MDMKIVVNSFEDLSKAAKDLEGCADNYSETVRKMNGWVDQLSGAWEGKDQKAFETQMKEFSKDLKKMAEKIREASKTLEQEKQNYVDHQNHVAHVVTQLAH